MVKEKPLMRGWRFDGALVQPVPRSACLDCLELAFQRSVGLKPGITTV